MEVILKYLKRHFSFYIGVVLCWLWKVEHTENNLRSVDKKTKEKMNPFLFMIYVSSLCDSRCMTCHRSTNVLFLKEEELNLKRK
jgi:hypothetical protein